MKKYIKIFSLLILLVFVFTLSACDAKTFAIALGYKKLEMYVGETFYLTTNYEELGEDGSPSWQSSDENIATITEDGCLVALSEGITYITASFNTHEAKIYLIVRSDDSKRKLSLSGTQMVLIGKTTKLNASISLNEDEEIIWTSSDDKVASVDSRGEVTGVKTGLVVIRASLSSDSSIYDDINILVRSGDGIQDVIVNKIYNSTYDYIGSTDLTSLSNKVVDTVADVKDCVIGVSNYKRSGLNNYSLSGVGSGVIYKKEDLGEAKYKYTLLTNYHVIENQDKVKVYIGGSVDKEFDAELVKVKKDDDLAIVSFEYDKVLPVATFAGEADTIVGDFVIAIGNPNGYDYYNSVTFGMASYIGRRISGETASFIQHDAAINPGNSGGALFNLEGKLIGINTMKIAKVTVEGMGFAIDLATVNAFLNQE